MEVIKGYSGRSLKLSVMAVALNYLQEQTFRQILCMILLCLGINCTQKSLTILSSVNHGENLLF